MYVDRKMVEKTTGLTRSQEPRRLLEKREGAGRVINEWVDLIDTKNKQQIYDIHSISSGRYLTCKCQRHTTQVLVSRYCGTRWRPGY